MRSFVLGVAAAIGLTVPAAADDVRYVYDALGRITQVVYTTASGVKTVTYEYDAAGNIINVTVT